MKNIDKYIVMSYTNACFFLSLPFFLAFFHCQTFNGHKSRNTTLTLLAG